MKITLPKSLYEHITSLAKESPRKIALVATDEKGTVTEEITYAELLEKIEAAAAELKSLGLQRGDRIALAFRNSPALLIWSCAAWASGIVTVPMDTKRDTPEIYEYKISLNKAKVLILEQGIQAIKLPGVRTKVHTEFKWQGDALPFNKWEKGLSHQALVLFTSGTTGHPKGAMLSLENLLVNADSIQQWLRITAEDTFLVNLPLHHINSTTFCLATLLAGGTIVIPPNYSNSHFWAQVAKTGATITSIVQSILFDQLRRESEFAAVRADIKLNRIQIGSAPVIAQTVQEFMKKFGISLYQGYGHTETALRVTGVPMGLPPALYERLVEENSIGTAMPWADVQIADNTGKILGEDVSGEIIVKGPAVMRGYVGDEPAFRDGYFLTGDIGLFKNIEGKRFFFIRGRKKEMIIKGGINVSPIAVENSLKKVSSSIDQAYVIAVPDQRYGEEIAAVVCWKPNVDEVSAKRHLKMSLMSGTPFLSAYETPIYITSLKTGDLPLTSTGKVQRTVLKDKLALNQLESIYTLITNAEQEFSILTPHAPLVAASHALYNHCWQPLTMELAEYKKNTAKQFILVVVNQGGKLAGQIAFIRTDLSAKQLLNTTYDKLLTPEVSNPNGTAVVCVSICSADYRSKEIPSVTRVPDTEEVLEYLPLDPVYKFHQKPKGGGAGAELVGLIPNGRPEDASSLGYNMLLKYPAPSKGVAITEEAPVSNQLIEAALVIAKDIGITDVYAYSRPGGLASYMSGQDAPQGDCDL